MRWTIVILLSVIPPRIAQAQTQEKKIGAVTTDARVEIDARDNGDVVIRGFSLVSTIICVSQVGAARDWTKASSAAIDSSAAKQGESAISNGAPMLRGIPECVAQLVRAPAPAPGYRFELKRTSDDARVATTMSPDDARRFLSYMTIAADSAESMVMRRDPTLLARRAPLY